MQEDVVINGGVVSGTLKYLAEGALVDSFGAGNFLAFKFTLPTGYTYANVKAGLSPSQGSQLVQLDADLNGVWKIADKNLQDFIVEATKDGVTHRAIYSLNGLTLETE